MMKSRSANAAAVAWSIFGGCTLAIGQWYELQPAAGFQRSSPQGINSDGSLVGVSERSADGATIQNYVWTPNTGKVAITPSPLGFSSMRGSSDLGAWVGYAPEFGLTGWITAKILYRDGTLVSLGHSPSYRESFAQDCDAMCTTVIGGDRSYVRVGISMYEWRGQPFVWTATGGRQSLPHAVSGATYTVLNGVSRDGRIAAGYSGNQSYGTAVTWTAETGYRVLPLPAGSPRSFHANDISGDGSVVIGLCSSPTGAGQNWSTYWDAAGAHVIDTAGWVDASPKLTNGDGSVIVGSGINLSSAAIDGDDAWIFTGTGGARSLRQYFIDMGLSVSADHTVLSISGISQDGRTFSGTARNPLTNHYIGFVATVPAPGSLLLLAAFGMAGGRRRRGAGGQ